MLLWAQVRSPGMIGLSAVVAREWAVHDWSIYTLGVTLIYGNIFGVGAALPIHTIRVSSGCGIPAPAAAAAPGNFGE